MVKHLPFLEFQGKCALPGRIHRIVHEDPILFDGFLPNSPLTLPLIGWPPLRMWSTAFLSIWEPLYWLTGLCDTCSLYFSLCSCVLKRIFAHLDLATCLEVGAQPTYSGFRWFQSRLMAQSQKGGWYGRPNKKLVLKKMLGVVPPTLKTLWLILLLISCGRLRHLPTPIAASVPICFKQLNVSCAWPRIWGGYESRLPSNPSQHLQFPSRKSCDATRETVHSKKSCILLVVLYPGSIWILEVMITVLVCSHPNLHSLQIISNPDVLPTAILINSWFMSISDSHCATRNNSGFPQSSDNPCI